MWCLCSALLYFGLFVAGLYIWNRHYYKYWTKKGIQGPQPTFLTGHILDTFMGKSSIGDVFTKIYNDTKQLPYAGAFMMLQPTLVINDIELIKTIMVKEFVHFSDHSFQINAKYEPLSAHLFNLTGEKWKNLRCKLTPAFTTSRIKGMFDIVAECAVEMNTYLDEQIKQDDLFDMKEIMAKLNTDVIGSCAFGVECNSFKNPDAEFRKFGRRIFELSFFQGILMFLTVFMPSLMKFYRGSIAGNDVTDFFYNTVKSTIKHRKDNNIVRKDFMQLLIQLQTDGAIDDETTGTKEETVNDGTRLTTMQVAAQVFVFFIAGFETSSSTASFALYELSLNPDIQDKVREEIDEVLAKHDNKITYDALGEMTYLNKVIEETLRKYPPLPLLFRVCTKNYVIPGTDITIEKDTPVMIPILGIQRDPEFYPEPNKFDPERFTPENKAARHHFAYLPFGEGPRICIGSRFGLMQTKLGLVSVLSKYELSVCEKTSIPMVFDKKAVLMVAEGGVWLKLKKRTK